MKEYRGFEMACSPDTMAAGVAELLQLEQNSLCLLWGTLHLGLTVGLLQQGCLT